MTTHQDLDSHQSETLPSLYRVQNRRTRRRKEKRSFIERPFLDLFLLLICPAATWLLVSTFLPNFDLGNIATQLGKGAIVIGLPTLVISLLASGWRLRWRINHYQPWWNDACPSCASDVLKRKKRHRIDYLIGRFGIPVRRYICADCHWQGRLIDERQVV